MARVLGVSCYFHDAAAVRVEDGALVLAAEEERFTRKKHDASFPRRAIEFCLEPGPVDYVAFYENPKVKFNRVLTTAAAMGKPARDAFVHSMRAWLTERHGITGRLASLTGVPRDRVVFADHHLSHAASAYFPSEFDSAAVITVDGVGEWATATIGRAASGNGGHRLEIEGQVDFPHSLGLFYSAFTDFLGFEVNEGEYKVMGMAPYGEPRFVDELSRVLRTYGGRQLLARSRLLLVPLLRAQGLDRQGDAAARDGAAEARRALPARRGAQPAVRRHRRQRPGGDRARDRQPRPRRARAHRLDEPLLRGGRGAERDGEPPHPRGDRDPASSSCPPAPGDSGAALGAALLVEHLKLGRSERVPLQHAYWGSRYSSTQIAAALEEAEGVEYRELPDEGAVLAETVDALAAGEVVGWFQGRFEFGPRALGNRSILADPRGAEMKERINEKIKFREPFRPFAPAAAEELAETLLPPELAHQHPARFMLLICRLDPELASRMAAVNHFGTARLQTVREEWNPRFFHLLERWGEQQRHAGAPEHVLQPARRADRRLAAGRAPHLRAERARPARARELRRP